MIKTGKDMVKMWIEVDLEKLLYYYREGNYEKMKEMVFEILKHLDEL